MSSNLGVRESLGDLRRKIVTDQVYLSVEEDEVLKSLLEIFPLYSKWSLSAIVALHYRQFQSSAQNLQQDCMEFLLGEDAEELDDFLHLGSPNDELLDFADGSLQLCAQLEDSSSLGNHSLSQSRGEDTEISLMTDIKETDGVHGSERTNVLLPFAYDSLESVTSGQSGLSASGSKLRENTPSPSLDSQTSNSSGGSDLPDFSDIFSAGGSQLHTGKAKPETYDRTLPLAGTSAEHSSGSRLALASVMEIPSSAALPCLDSDISPKKGSTNVRSKTSDHVPLTGDPVNKSINNCTKTSDLEVLTRTSVEGNSNNSSKRSDLKAFPQTSVNGNIYNSAKTSNLAALKDATVKQNIKNVTKKSVLRALAQDSTSDGVEDLPSITVIRRDKKHPYTADNECVGNFRTSPSVPSLCSPVLSSSSVKYLGKNSSYISPTKSMSLTHPQPASCSTSGVKHTGIISPSKFKASLSAPALKHWSAKSPTNVADLTNTECTGKLHGLSKPSTSGKTMPSASATSGPAIPDLRSEAQKKMDRMDALIYTLSGLVEASEGQNADTVEESSELMKLGSERTIAAPDTGQSLSRSESSVNQHALVGNASLSASFPSSLQTGGKLTAGNKRNMPAASAVQTGKRKCSNPPPTHAETCTKNVSSSQTARSAGTSSDGSNVCKLHQSTSSGMNMVDSASTKGMKIPFKCGNSNQHRVVKTTKSDATSVSQSQGEDILSVNTLAGGGTCGTETMAPSVSVVAHDIWAEPLFRPPTVYTAISNVQPPSYPVLSVQPQYTAVPSTQPAHSAMPYWPPSQTDVGQARPVVLPSKFKYPLPQADPQPAVGTITILDDSQGDAEETVEAAPGKSIVVPDDTPPVVDLTSPSDAPSEHPGLEFGISSVLEVFPGTDRNYVKQVLKGFLINSTLDQALHRTMDYLLENPPQPVEQTPEVTVLQMENSQTASSSRDYYKDYCKFPAHYHPSIPSDRLSMEFRSVRLCTINDILSRYSNYYAPAHHCLTQAVDAALTRFKEQHKNGDTCTTRPTELPVKILRDGECEHIIKSCFLKTPRTFNERKLHSDNKDLMAEVNFVAQRSKLDKEEMDRKMAWALLESEYEEQGQAIECGCCFSEHPFENLVQCSEGHLFCCQCLVGYVREAVFGSGKLNLTCMTEDCDSDFPKSQLLKALPSDVLQKYDERMAEENLNKAAMPDLVRCPSCNIAAVLDPQVQHFKCPNASCRKETCRDCKADWSEHRGKTCDQIEKKDETALRTSYEEKMTKARVRTCPSCQTQFFKEEGCNKMTCRCGMTLCYICRLPKITYKHFCQHPRDPGKDCTVCKNCSLWSNPDEDEKQAIAEIQREAQEKRKEQGYSDEKLIGAPDERPVKRHKSN